MLFALGAVCQTNPNWRDLFWLLHVAETQQSAEGLFAVLPDGLRLASPIILAWASSLSCECSESLCQCAHDLCRCWIRCSQCRQVASNLGGQVTIVVWQVQHVPAYNGWYTMGSTLCTPLPPLAVHAAFNQAGMSPHAATSSRASMYPCNSWYTIFSLSPLRWINKKRSGRG